MQSGLKIAFAGSVDDGKSTLFGRLVHDVGAYYKDELEHVVAASARRGFARTELALLTDGLRAEREQGITIDVAHRTVVTPRRRLLIADAPGHVEYTRNMITACTAADVAVLLVDARRGLTEQSHRHLSIAALLRVGTILVCVNKMDRVDFDAARFAELAAAAQATVQRSAELEYGTAPAVVAIPTSALHGDNVVTRSERMPFYAGPPLLTLLEDAPVSFRDVDGALRLPVQWVLRPQDDDYEDYRGYAGRIVRGTLAQGDVVRAVRSGQSATVTHLEGSGDTIQARRAGESVVVRLSAPIDLARGDVLVRAGEPDLLESRRIDATLLWLDEPPALGSLVRLKHGTRTLGARISALAPPLEWIGVRAEIELEEPLAFDRFADDRSFGAFLLADAKTGSTHAAGLLRTARP